MHVDLERAAGDVAAAHPARQGPRARREEGVRGDGAAAGFDLTFESGMSAELPFVCICWEESWPPGMAR